MRRWLVALFGLGLAATGLTARAPEIATPPLSLQDLTRICLERHPKLQQAELAVEIARGQAVQAGLYPNPVLTFTGDEFGDRTGPGGILTPMISQEFVTKRKLQLSRSAAQRGVDQAAWKVASQKFALLTSVRQAFFDLLTIQARLDVQTALVTLGEQSVSTSEKLEAARQASRIDVLQLTVDLERFRAEADALRGELPAAYRKLMAVAGAVDLPPAPIIGTLDAPLPGYDLNRIAELVAVVNPEIQVAQIGVDRSRLLLARAQAEPFPNVTFGAGYTRQNQNRSDDWSASVAMPIPTWNRNQGNIRSAQAQLNDAIQEIARVELELNERVASACREYIAARRRAERYRDTVLPRARELVQLTIKAQEAGQFETLKVLVAQRDLQQARLEYVKSLGDAWKAAAAIAGLTLEEPWPPTLAEPVPQPKPGGERK